jgi:hypothetical protein
MEVIQMKVGYRRVSTVDQNLDRQELGPVERVFEEKVSGKNTDRAALQEMIAFVREGDEVLVYSIDRLARDLRDLQTIIQMLLDKKVSISFLSERLSASVSSWAIGILATSRQFAREGFLQEGLAEGVYMTQLLTITRFQRRKLRLKSVNTFGRFKLNIKRRQVNLQLTKEGETQVRPRHVRLPTVQNISVVGGVQKIGQVVIVQPG